MNRETDEPMNGNTEHVDPAGWDGSSEELEVMDEMDEVFDEQDEDTYRILAMLNQEHLEDAFGSDGTASELDETPEFSQAFMDGMRTMVADRFGQEAADQFMALNHNQIKNKKESHHQPKNVSETEKAMSQADAPMTEAAETPGAERPSRKNHFHINTLFSTWPRRVAAILVAVGLIFGIYQGGVMATRLPAVDTEPQHMEDYAKVGSLKEIISNFEISGCPKELEHVYVPEVVAEGYVETEREQVSKQITLFYENSSDQWYQYRQMTVSANTFLDTEQGEWESVIIGEYPGLYTVNDAAGKLWWFDYQYAYCLIGNLTEKEMEKVAESLYELEE